MKENYIVKQTMTSLSPNNRLSSPGSSNDDPEQNQTPPPLEMPPEIRIFQQQICSEKEGLNNNSVNEQNYQTDWNQMPTQNSKKSFCIDALLAKNQAGDESDLENKRSFTQFVNNNYKESVISRDLNNSPEDQMSR